MSDNQTRDYSKDIDAYAKMQAFKKQTEGMSKLQARLLAEEPELKDNVSDEQIKAWANEDFDF